MLVYLPIRSWESELRQMNADIFQIVAFNSRTAFKRNSEGKVTGVQIIVGDTNMEGQKTELPFKFILSLWKKRDL